MTRPIGLIAGQGTLPILVARGIRAAGHPVHAIGLRDQFLPELRAECDRFETAGIVQLGRWIRLARKLDVTDAVMVGRVSKGRMHDPLRWFRQLPDRRAIDLWYRRLRHDKRSATLLTALAEELAANGLVLVDSTSYIPDHLALEGVMTRRRPSADEARDVAFGWPMLAQSVSWHIGQSLAVRECDVIAVEAVEGTDRMVDRAGELCRRRGWTLLKTSAPDHDMRADVPTIGVPTIERLAERGASCLAIGAGRVIMIDRPAVLAAADRLRIAIVGIGGAGPEHALATTADASMPA